MRQSGSETWPTDPVERAAAAAAAGLRRPVAPGTPAALDGLVAGDPDPRVRAAALGALARLPDPPRRDLAPGGGRRRPVGPPPGRETSRPSFAAGAGVAGGLLVLLGDAEAAVAETAAWALGELGLEAVGPDAVGRLSEVARSHGDPLGAGVGGRGTRRPRGPRRARRRAGRLRDKPTIRRRAVLALAAFEGPEVDAALQAALADKDWQIRQAAEDLLG